MALPSPDFPTTINDGNEQDTGNDLPGDDTIANAADYNEHSAEIIAIENFIQQHQKMVVWNSTGGILTASTIVYANGYNTTDDFTTVDQAQANTSSTPAIGMVESDISDASAGTIIQIGPVSVNTTGQSIGDPVYLSTTAGGFTFAPTRQRIGTVLTVGASGWVYLDFTLLTKEEEERTTTTTDNSTTTIATIALDDDTVYIIEAYIVARRTDSAGRAGYHRRALVYREAGGSATISGTIDTGFTREEAATNPYDATINVSGNNALIEVNGQNGHTVNWKSFHKLREVI